MSWEDNAKCKGDPNPERWFNTGASDRQNLLDLQDICALCPVRNGCGKAVMEEESGCSSEVGRYTFRAYMTPEQRAVIHRLGGLQGRDPMKVVLGLGLTLKKRGRPARAHVPPIPEGGVDWNRAHTALARKLTKWLEVNIKAGRYIPGDNRLCKMLGCSPERLHIVLDALLQSGTIIEHEPQRYVRTTN